MVKFCCLNRVLTVIVLESLTAFAAAGVTSGGGPLPARVDGPAMKAESLNSETGIGPEEAFTASAPGIYQFFPMGGTLYGDLFTTGFVDLDTAYGRIRDWDCTDITYDGHTGVDVVLKTFGEQAIGVPVFAALDGVVTEAHDGEFDQNTSTGYRAANYATINHGNGRVCLYYHFKKGSVAVSVGQTVKAGQQLALAGSSGNSDWPHLHFVTRQNSSTLEPYAGPCRAGASLWANQTPINRSFYLQDFAVTHQDMTSHPGPPWDMPRGGQIGLSDAGVCFWAFFANLPSNPEFHIQLARPDGSIAAADTQHLTQPYQLWSWRWWRYDTPDLHTISGTWQILLDMNGTRVIDAPFEVRSERTADFNRPPAPITVSFEPSPMAPADVVFCRVAGPPVLDDPDYDIVRYEYTWKVNDAIVRQVTTAALSDAIPHDLVTAGDVLSCKVIPGDGRARGPVASVSAVVQRVPGPVVDADLDDDGDVDLSDFSRFQLCVNAPGEPVFPVECLAADLDHDSDVDQSDLDAFQSCLGGANQLPACD